MSIRIIAEHHNHATGTFCRIAHNSTTVQPYGFTVEMGRFDKATGTERTLMTTIPMHGLTAEQAEHQYMTTIQASLDNGRLKIAA